MPSKVTLIILILISALICTGCQKEEPVSTQLSDTVIIQEGITFMPQGIIQISNGPVRFTSIATGETTVLCDKPDCRHEPFSHQNPAPSCLAQIPGLQMFTIYRGRQLFICNAEGSPFTVKVYTADINGTNRRMLAEIKNILSIRHVMIRDDTLAMAYVNNYSMDEAGLLEALEQPETGLAIVDMTTGRAHVTPAKSGYLANIRLLSVNGNSVTYTFSAREQEMFNRDAYYKGGEELEQWLNQLSAHTTNQLCTYDTSTQQETLILRYNGGPSLYGVIGSYAIGRPNDGRRLQLVPLDGGEPLTFAENTDGRLNVLGIEGDWVYYSDYNLQNGTFLYYRYNLNTEKTDCLNENHKTAFAVDVILEDLVYGFGEDEEFFHGVLRKQDFLNGNFDAVEILVYPNRDYGE